MRLKRERFGYLVDPWRVRSSLPKAASSDGFPCGELMRACWAATLLVLAQPSPASYATCTSTSVVPRVLALTHRHLHKSPSVRQPFVEISGSIAFSPLWFLSRKLCPIFVCQFKGSLHGFNWTPIFREGSSDRILVLSSSPVHSSACLTSRWQSRKQSDRSLTRLNL